MTGNPPLPQRFKMDVAGVLFTIGHSTHPLEDFVALLRKHGVERIVDVRTVPKSRHCPQFNSDALQESLDNAGIGYAHVKALGGLRKTRKDSINTGWRNLSFRGYADYMETPEFAKGLDELAGIATRRHTAIMCAEAVPWRCHRSLIADAMMVRGWKVREIVGSGSAREHALTSFLKITAGQLSYPAGEEQSQATLSDIPQE